MRSRIQSILLALSAVSALVSTRIFRGQAPQGATKPYLTWTVADFQDEAGITQQATGGRAEIEINIFGPSGTQNEDIFEALQSDLGNQRLVEDGYTFRWYLDNSADLEETQTDGDETPIPSITSNWIVWINQ